MPKKEILLQLVQGCDIFQARLTRLHPYFEEQLSQDNRPRNIFLLNYHNISHKMNKLLNLDIKVKSSYSHDK